MLPHGKGKGQIWLGSRYLCDVEYDISNPVGTSASSAVQRLTLTVAARGSFGEPADAASGAGSGKREEEDCVQLLDAYDLSLLLAYGSRHPKGGYGAL